MHLIIIAGCGRLGSHIADFYSGQGFDVVVLDKDETAFERLSADFSGFTIPGSVAEFGVLNTAGLGKADLFVAVTESDTLNIMCAEIALNYFKVPRVFARVYEPSLEEFCQSLGILAVSPITATSDRFLDEIQTASEGRYANRL
jgi:trk system potassium uptake protein TrkA